MADAIDDAQAAQQAIAEWLERLESSSRIH
jgi:hypothetical protein